LDFYRENNPQFREKGIIEKKLKLVTACY